MEFKSFGKIEQIGKLFMSITQKLHGTNSQLFFDEHGNYKAGSRTRWLELQDDNYGFCNWVEKNKIELFSILGEGRHYGEWCGIGINKGEGLEKKTLCLFNHRRWDGKELPENVMVVPEIYRGAVDIKVIEYVMDRLKASGSFLVPSYLHPEGIVIEVAGNLYKKVFDPEDTQWVPKKALKVHVPRETIDTSHLLQPLRLEKLLSRDERFIRDYPESLRNIAFAYMNDLEEENQITDSEKTNQSFMKELTQQTFLFIKNVMRNK